MREKGYSLIELLVAVIILGVLATLLLASYGRSQANARDTRRKADLDIVKIYLESYFNDHNQYPTKGEIVFGSPFNPYMSRLPVDPKYPQRNYCYDPLEPDLLSYTLGADFEMEQGTTVRCTAVSTPAPTSLPPSPSAVPTAGPTSAATAIPTPTPTPTPLATHLPNGNCTPCQRMVDQDVNPGLVVGYCCPVSPNELFDYNDSSCAPPPAGLGNTISMTDCSTGCSDPPTWKQIAPTGDCISDFIGPGQQVGDSCVTYGCGSIIGGSSTFCTIYDYDDSCPTSDYRETGCLCN